MPNRIIKESIHTSRTLASISADSERLFWRLVTAADDYGRYHGEPDIVLGKCLPAFIGRTTIEQVSGWLGELEQADLIRRYQHSGETFLFLATWDEHQRPPRAKQSKFPAPQNGQMIPENTNRQQMPTNDSGCQQMTTDAPVSVSVFVSENRESRDEKRAPAREVAASTDSLSPPSSDLSAVMTHYHEQIGMLGPTQFEKLAFWVDEQGMAPEVVCAAIDEAIIKDKRHPSYIEAIIRNWHNEGVRTLGDVQARARADPGGGYDEARAQEHLDRVLGAIGGDTSSSSRGTDTSSARAKPRH